MEIGIVNMQEIFKTDVQLGVQRRIYEEAIRLAKKGHQITLFVPGKKFSREDFNSKIQVMYIPTKYTLHPLRNLTYNINLLRTSISRLGIDLFEAHLDAGWIVFFSKKIKYLRVPTVHVVHGLFLDEFLNIWRYKSQTSLQEKLRILNLIKSFAGLPTS